MHLARIVAAAILIVPCAALAQYVPPNAPKTDEEKAFYSAVAKAIFQLVPAERGRFGLTLDDRQPPTFPGPQPNTLESVPCEQIAAFGMLGYATQLGHVAAAVCANGAKVRELSIGARGSLAALLKQFGAKESEARRAGWYYAQETLADGAEYYYFPVLLISHGVVGPVSGVLYDKKTGKALVVQAEVRQMCGEGLGDRFKDAPFCTDLGAAVKRLVIGLRGVL